MNASEIRRPRRARRHIRKIILAAPPAIRGASKTARCWPQSHGSEPMEIGTIPPTGAPAAFQGRVTTWSSTLGPYTVTLDQCSGSQSHRIHGQPRARGRLPGPRRGVGNRQHVPRILREGSPPAFHLTIGSTGTLNISGDTDKTLTEGVINNQGTTIWTGSGNLQFYGGATFNNLAGSTFVAENDAAMLWIGYAQGNFNNAGTFRKQGTGGTTTLTSYGFAFNNSGLLDVQSGTATVAGSEGGAFNTATGATLDFSGARSRPSRSTGTGLTEVTGG